MSDSNKIKSRRERKKSSKKYSDKLIDFILSKWFRYILTILIILIMFVFLYEYLLREKSKVVKLNEPISKSVELNKFVFSIEIPRTRFKNNKIIPILLRVKNIDSLKKALFFTSGQKFDISILNSSRAEVWRWSKGRIFTMAIEEIPLKSQQETFFETKWKQNDFGAQIVPTGIYYVIGKCVSSEWQPTVETQIEIEP
jgi:hypothetical protein